MARIAAHIDGEQPGRGRVGPANPHLGCQSVGGVGQAEPTEGGQHPQAVGIRLRVFQGRLGTASLALGWADQREVARRLACDAEIISIVLALGAKPLDVGRAPCQQRFAAR